MNQEKYSYTISEEVFAQFPGYHRGVVLCFGVRNGSSPPELIQLLRAEEAALRKRLDIASILEDERINSWREAYRSFGAKPGKFRPSMEAMTRRVLKNNDLPSISKLVDIGNVISLRHLVPAGGHAIDLIEGDLTLRQAIGDEIFIPFGSEQIENPLPGEVIFTEGKTVLTRRWTWRQANHTILTDATSAVEFNVDGLPPVGVNDVEKICCEIVDLVQRFCGGDIRYEILKKEHPQLVLEV
ncbi:MAG: hypothetical protein DRI56_01655 [Chloroflexota bacterium]|nr:MAG: hypothetical protein DRI56_01655 [Chloroflexota bacterium]